MSLSEAVTKFGKKAWSEFWKNLPASIYMICTYFIVQGYNSMNDGYKSLQKKLNQIDINSTEISQIKTWHSEDSAYKDNQVLKYADLQKWDYNQDQHLNKLDNRVDANENNLDFVMGIKRK